MIDTVLDCEATPDRPGHSGAGPQVGRKARLPGTGGQDALKALTGLLCGDAGSLQPAFSTLIVLYRVDLCFFAFLLLILPFPLPIGQVLTRPQC